MASICISQFNRSWLSSVSVRILENSLQVHLHTSQFTWSLLPWLHNHVLQVYRQTHWITPSKFISKLEQSWPRSLYNHRRQLHLRTDSNTTSKCNTELTSSETNWISKHAPSWYHRCTSSLIQHQPPGGSWSWLKCTCQFNWKTYLGTALNCISRFTQSAYAAGFLIALQ